MKLEELQTLHNGARFFRADLHIHSYCGSHDVKDVSMTPEAIVNLALIEKIDIIAITDHNEISNVKIATDFAKNKPLLIIPGIELSTHQGHLLCYLPDVQKLESFHGRLNIAERGTQNSRCQNAIFECLNLLENLGGFAILAHIEVESGFEFENPGYAKHKVDILCHKALLGLELKKAECDIFYSPIDNDKLRVGIGKQRIDKLKLGSSQFLARVLSSDAHSLAALGRNAVGNKKITRIKMDKPTFLALKIALEDSDARVRIEDQIPNAIPKILAIQLEGGFLDAQKIHLSPNLNCIIGGRGTGKSTTFEAIKCISGKLSGSKVVDSEVWPNNLFVACSDQAEQIHVFQRALGGVVTNISDPSSGPKTFNIESYSQGETERISKEAQTNPVALLTYLDRFVEVSEVIEKETGYRESLTGIYQDIEKTKKIVDQIPAYESALVITRQQLAALEKAKAKDLIELMRKLELEREIRNKVEEQLLYTKDLIGSNSVLESIEKISELGLADDLTIGKDEFKKILESTEHFQTQLTETSSKDNAAFLELEGRIKTEIVKWKEKEKISVAEIDNKKKELAANNITLDIIYIQKLAKEEAQNETNVKNAKTWLPELKRLVKHYKNTSKERWDSRNRVAMIRSAFAKEASATLKSVLNDLKVTLSFVHNAYSPVAEEQIKQAMNWRTSQVPRAQFLIRQMTLPVLLEAIDSKDTESILKIKTPEQTPLFDQAEAERLVQQLSIPAIRHALEICEVFDVPKLSVTKFIKDGDGNDKVIVKDFSKLSLGQQQSVLLSLMLSSKSNSPLIIDQPEDNLDGEFIYHSLVPVLRLAKERRQIIIVTHNPNIAVLGDAEQIIVLKSTNEKSMIVSSGSIDDSATKNIACVILEGASEAFQRRSKIYGLG